MAKTSLQELRTEQRLARAICGTLLQVSVDFTCIERIERIEHCDMHRLVIPQGAQRWVAEILQFLHGHGHGHGHGLFTCDDTAFGVVTVTVTMTP